MATTFDRALARFINLCLQIVAVHDLVTKWRIEMVSDYHLDIYLNETLSKYSYALIKGGQRILGWDNAPHHPALANFPHHVHQPEGQVDSSSLNGDPEHDLEEIRNRIEIFFVD